MEPVRYTANPIYSTYFRPIVFFFYVPLNLIVMHIDPIKDWLLIVRLVVSLGGPVIIFNALIDHHSFSSMVRISIQIARAIFLGWLGLG